MHQQQKDMMEQMHSMQAQQAQILQNQQQMQGYFNQWETANAQRERKLDRVNYGMNDLRLQFDNFQRYQQPPP
jgi:hypothetical protein